MSSSNPRAGQKDRFLRKRRQEVGARPGTLLVSDEALAPRITLIDYTATDLEEREVDDVGSLEAIARRPSVTWVDIQGLGDAKVLGEIQRIFSLHDLLMEDVVNVPQRPKVEEFDDHLLFVTRQLALPAPGVLTREQVSIVLGKNYILTFQEWYGDVLDPVRKRLRAGNARIRKSGPDYVTYAILDTIIDGYLPVLEELGDVLERFEHEVMDPRAETLQALNELKSTFLVLRRLVWPQRDALNRLIRDGSALIKEKTRLYFRDTHDNCIQTAEIIDSFRELQAGLVSTYLSAASNRLAITSNRTNDVMKVLTIMASIFIPLTFVAGIYGMNFENMPELHARWSYPVVLLVMIATALGMLLYFKKRGWIWTRDDGGEGGANEDRE